jgi:hypothetical protein
MPDMIDEAEEHKDEDKNKKSGQDGGRAKTPPTKP